ncbi:MAG: ribosome small subunit-dependent GTPase A [Lachnospiraceae bacterium]|nr:ribosome small subunit-dependent GTPase A [Lachnospiraceae bacterium]
MQGKIVKGIAGFYYVHIEGKGIFECKAKGIFRKEHIKPLVGDNVEMDILDEGAMTGNIVEILPRQNALIRPAVANIDQALVIFAIVKPDPNFNLLDRFLIAMQKQGIDSIICFNKQDIATEEEKENLRQAYEACGCQVLFASANENEGIDVLKELLHNKTTAVAGPSGVGKSSIINRLQPEIQMETGAISEKIARGKHTTRHSELIYIQDGTYIMDTPGFSSLDVVGMEKEELREYYPEFINYEPMCKFQGCVHIHEPKCGVKDALAEGKISEVRYKNYCLLYEELKAQRKY